MADDVIVDNGELTDYTVSTDEAAGGKHVQRVKLALSADGSEAHVPADADGLLVNLGANNDVSVTGSVDVTNAGLTELAAAIDTEVQVDVVGALPAGNNNIGDVDVASSALPTGAATSAKQDTVIGHLDGVEGILTTIDTDTGKIADAIFTDDTAFTPATSKLAVIGAQADETATDSVDEGDAGALRMTLARELYVKEGRSSSSAVTSVSDTASTTQLLAAAAGRKGFRITNDSSALLYVKFGTSASTTDYTVRLATGDYLEDNFYTGRVDGIWASDPGDGAARITELT